MCFFKKRFKELNEKIDKLSDTKLKKLESDSEELKQIKSLLSNIHLKVKSVIPMEDGSFKVVYDMPSLIINSTDRNETFYAINRLDLISLEDMRKIDSMINKGEQ